MTFFRVLRHLLPTGRAWRLTVDKALRQFFKAISSVGDDVKVAADQAFLDRFPLTTTRLAEYEQQFGLSATNLTEQQRRERLLGAWRSFGGQSPYYLQNVLQASGFPVFVHDWWDPVDRPPVGSNMCVMARDPFAVLRPTYVDPGDGSGVGLGYPLVNILPFYIPSYVVECGEPTAECGENEAEAGNSFFSAEKFVDYEIPTDPDKWAYFGYVGGETFGDLVQIPAIRKDEFENLLLQIFPDHLWIGVLVEYV